MQAWSKCSLIGRLPAVCALFKHLPRHLSPDGYGGDFERYGKEVKGPTMRALILNGSARKARGVTGRLLSSLAKGMAEGGAEVQEIEIQSLNILPCTACLSCMHKIPGECTLVDDMPRIYSALKTSDTLILATPVYLDGMSGLMKMVMDRCMCCMEPFLQKDASGRVRHTYVWRMPTRFVLVSTAGFPERETFDPLIATFRAQAANVDAVPVAEICIPGSIALQVSPDRLSPHLTLIEEAGRELASGGAVSDSLLLQINTPPLSVDEYLALSKKYEAWCRKQLGLGKA